jgi:hypothetical protein
VNLSVTGHVGAVSREDNHWNGVAETAAKIRQQIQAGILTEGDVELSEKG